MREQHRSFAWTRFYVAIADKLRAFRGKRDALVAGLHDIASRTKAPFALQDKFANGSQGPLKDICPFTTITTFNRGISDDNRKIIADELAKFLGVKEPVPDFFGGIPVLPRMAWLFGFEKDRKPDDIDTLWEVFERAILFAESDGEGEGLSAFKESFNNAIGIRGVSWNLTMGLYWIRPSDFPALDTLSRDYIRGELGVSIPSKLSANEYLEIRDKLKTKFGEDDGAVHSFPELSLSAWDKNTPPDDKHVEKHRKKEYVETGTATNRILYGPPGTGKTYQLNKLTEKYSERFEFVTFHQAYSYEDFVEGIRPRSDKDGNMKYEVVPGVFKRICQKAKANPGQRYAIFIDEINRGNIASIFGELITLLEPDKRIVCGDNGAAESGMTLTLPYSGEKFGVPKNLNVYGAMNTADRSIALLDTALRRRFQFEELMPDPSVIEGSLKNGHIEDGEDGTIDLRALLEKMNDRIRFLLSRDMTIGHSYLINVRNFNELKDVLLSRIIPLLQEYFYDNWHRIQLVFQDVGPNGEKRVPQIIRHEPFKEMEILGFDHDDFEDSVDYSVIPLDEITPDAIRKIYEKSG